MCWRLLRAVLPVLLLAAVFAVDPAAYRGMHAPKQYLLLILAPLAAAILVGCRRSDETVTLRLSVIELLLVARLVWIGVSHPEVLAHPSDVGVWLLGALTLLTISVRQWVPRWNSVERGQAASTESEGQIIWWTFVRVTWVFAAAQAALGLTQWVAFQPDGWTAIKTPLVGTIGAANGYGAWLALGIIAAMADAARRSRSYRFRYLLWTLAAFMFGTLVLNGSRGAIFALSCALVVVVMAHLWRGSTDGSRSWLPNVARRALSGPARWLVTAAAVLGLVALGAALFALNPASSSGRFMVWSISAPMATEHPGIGVGYGRFGAEYIDYQAQYFDEPSRRAVAHKATTLKQAHNEYLNAFCETGLVGGVLFMLPWLVAVLGLFRSATTSRRHGRLLVALSALALLVSILTHATVDAPLHVLPVAVVAYVILGFSPAKTWSISFDWRGVRRGISLALVVLAAYAALCAWRSYPGYRLWQRGLDQAQRSNPHAAASTYERALRHLPQQGELLFHYGSTLAQTGARSRGIHFMEEASRTFADRNLLLAQATAHLEMGDLYLAEQTAKHAHRAFPDHLAPQLLLGRIYHQQGRDELAKAALRRCVERRTHVQSPDVARIARAARVLWTQYYGEWGTEKQPGTSHPATSPSTTRAVRR